MQHKMTALVQYGDTLAARGKACDDRLRDCALSYMHDASLTTVGDEVPVDTDQGFLRGHGTILVAGSRLHASVCGVVERISRLVSVRPMRSKYSAETGDVVVGRVTEVAGKRWKVDILSLLDAQLLLSAVNLPGGVQRRRTAVDELSMRSLYVEGDVISAEVQSSHQDGSVSVHTRSLKYGKLVGGQLIQVPSYLIRRQKQHFHVTDLSVTVILGCNGYIWVGSSTSQKSEKDESLSSQERDREREGDGEDEDNCTSPGDVVMGEAGKEGKEGRVEGREENEEGDDVEVRQNVTVPIDLREKICRVARSVRVLSELGFPIYLGSILEVYKYSVESSVEIKNMLSPLFLLRLKERETKRREESGGRGAMER